jgi:hypothetical protein
MTELKDDKKKKCMYIMLYFILWCLPFNNQLLAGIVWTLNRANVRTSDWKYSSPDY